MAQLLKTKIKRNLYYEIKDRVLEEKFNGMTMQKTTRKVKVYGFDETKNSRELLMGILRDRMDNHKAKFISPIIYNELCTLEVKKNGRIEHSANAHDDQIFSYLMALYIWYEGKDVMERYGLQKGTILSDEDETTETGLEESMMDISSDMSIEDDGIIKDTSEFLKQSKTYAYEEWVDKQNEDNRKADEMLRNDPRSRKAWFEHNHLADDNSGVGIYTIPNEIFDSFYVDEKPKSRLQKEFDSIQDLR